MEPLHFELTPTLNGVAIIFLVLQSFFLFVAVVCQADGGSDAIRESLVSAKVHTHNALLGSFPSRVKTYRVVRSPKMMIQILPMPMNPMEEGTVKSLIRGGRQLL
jgi:hypothetical protein